MTPTEPITAPRPSAALLAGIEALERKDFTAAEKRFGEALAANRHDAVAAFASAYASRHAGGMESEFKRLVTYCTPIEPPGRLNERGSISQETRFEIEDFLARYHGKIADPDQAQLQYCLLEYYAANNYPDYIHESLEILAAPQYRAQLEPNQKYALGYWTLELSGRSVLPPPDQDAAETWLASAFKEWKETAQDEAHAGHAVLELLGRYTGPPHWYLDMVQRLGELRPKNFDIAYLLLTKLSDSKDAADADRAKFWFERAQGLVEGSSVPQPERPRWSAWMSYLAAGARLTKARLSTGQMSKDAAQEATNQLQMLIQTLRKDGLIGDEKWPGADAYGILIGTYLFRDQIDEAAKVLDASREDGLSERSTLLGFRVSLPLLEGRADEALQAAQRGRAVLRLTAFLEHRKARWNKREKEGGAGADRANALFLEALVQLLTGKPEAEKTALEVLETNHEYRDYIRLMLYWYLMRQKKDFQAKAYLEEHWRDINPASWRDRLANGDPQVWREQLIGYYLGYVSRNNIFAPLASREAFESSGLNRVGEFYYSMRCEAYFYDALLQEVTGEPESRAGRYAEALGRALEVGHGEVYEYQMARYLRRAGS